MNVSDIKKQSTTVTSEAFNKLSIDEQDLLRYMAIEALYLCRKGDYAGANEYIDSLPLEDMAVPFWSLFDSRDRAAMKKAKHENNR